MNTTDRLKRALNNPKLFIRGLNRGYHRWFGLRSENTSGIAVFDEDWDNLIILDACRYDMFEQVNHIEGSLTAKESKASATSEWLKANVAGRDLRDTVYVTANPQLEGNRENWNVDFHSVNNVWLNEGWDEETGTVLADTMTEAAIGAYETFPHKRLVVHYMQPHYPFVPSDTDFDKGHLHTIEDGQDSPDGENIWGKKFMRELKLSRQELWNIYTANLEYVLKRVEALLDVISGKTVITSDHGNYVGEQASPIPIQEYGHPRGLYDDAVVQVPWLEHTCGERRNIIIDSDSSDQSTVESEVISSRLRDLGYVE